MRGLRDLAAGAVRGPAGGGGVPADAPLRHQGQQLHPRHPRQQDRASNDGSRKFQIHGEGPY